MGYYRLMNYFATEDPWPENLKGFGYCVGLAAPDRNHVSIPLAAECRHLASAHPGSVHLAYLE